MSLRLLVASLATALALTSANAESHTIHFNNRCGYGTPVLKQNGNVISNGADYTANGPIYGAIAYLDTGKCGYDGDSCTLLETTLVNPTTPGGGSSSDISLIPNHAFSVTTGFSYYNGCDGAGASCDNANCPTAFHTTTDYWVQVACQTNDVNLNVNFC